MEINTVNVVQTQSGSGVLTATDVEHTFQLESDVVIADPDTHYWSCIDGRSTDAIFGTPGGDAGEFLLGLSTFDKFGGDVSTHHKVKTIFESFLSTIPSERQFYMHTDMHAIEYIQSQLGIPATTNFDIQNVPKGFHRHALNLLARDTGPPYSIGCGHLRLAITHAEEYDTPKVITKGLIRSFFKIKWNADHRHHHKLRLDYHDHRRQQIHSDDVVIRVLEGDHQEQGVLHVNSLTQSFNHSKQNHCAPMVTPLSFDPSSTFNATSVFVVHDPSLVGGLRRRIATFFAELLADRNPSRVRVDAFLDAVDTLAQSQFISTATYLGATQKPAFVSDFTLTN